MTISSYPYAAGNLLEKPQNYSYSGYFAHSFVHAWRNHRLSQLALLPEAKQIAQSNGNSLTTTDTLSLLNAICEFVKHTDNFIEGPHREWLARLLKKFEVTKRVYSGYDLFAPHRPVQNSLYTDLDLYIKLAECFILTFNKYGKLQYLNAFLKLQDTILSQSQKLTEIQQSNLAWLIENELAVLEELMKSKDLI
ncbi:hypothetical protein [Alteromonas ponticola]|uniref:Uncharacterized protein n=1 Tax=Alteromonas ponticola TaxID=2720613 RepID=A0ABX1R149_9ALTE|nr:hypothetical protein [Alteromonas ponticola]NMH59636.1 hypothetical protein [Alteromonas ponticola]